MRTRRTNPVPITLQRWTKQGVLYIFCIKLYFKGVTIAGHASQSRGLKKASRQCSSRYWGVWIGWNLGNILNWLPEGAGESPMEPVFCNSHKPRKRSKPCWKQTTRRTSTNGTRATSRPLALKLGKKARCFTISLTFMFHRKHISKKTCSDTAPPQKKKLPTKLQTNSDSDCSNCLIKESGLHWFASRKAWFA